MTICIAYRIPVHYISGVVATERPATETAIMTSRFDRSFASAQRAYDAMEAPCCDDDSFVSEEECEAEALFAAERAEWERIARERLAASITDADASDIGF